MQIYFHSRLWSYLPRVPILVEGTVCMYLRLSTPKTQLISAIFQLWSLRHTYSSREMYVISCWLKHLHHCPDGGNWNFQCFISFLTAAFYFLNLSYLLLHIITTVYLTLHHKTSHRGVLCCNSQKYTVWVKLIDFSFMPKLLCKDHVPWRYFVNCLLQMHQNLKAIFSII